MGQIRAARTFAGAAADGVPGERDRGTVTLVVPARGPDRRPAAAAYQLPAPVRTQAAALSLAVMLERQVAAAYLGLVAVHDAALRTFAAQNMRDSAVRAARWSGKAETFPGLPASSLRPNGQTAR